MTVSLRWYEGELEVGGMKVTVLTWYKRRWYETRLY